MESRRKELYKIQSGYCFWCGMKMLHPNDINVKSPLYPTIDHLVAKCAGGGNGDNLRAACTACNTLRGTYNVAYWAKLQKENVTLAKKNEELKREKERLAAAICKLIEDYKPWWRRWYENLHTALGKFNRVRRSNGDGKYAGQLDPSLSNRAEGTSSS